MRIPDCRRREDALVLTPEERRDLVVRIAEKGPEAIEDFVRERERAGDSTIAKRIARLREDLLRRAEELRRILSGSVKARREAIEERFAEERRKLEDERSATDRELRIVRASRAGVLDAAIASSSIAAAMERALSGEALPWWRRALAAIAKLLRFLLAVLLAPVRLLARALGLVKRVPPGRPTAFPRRGAVGSGAAARGAGDALASSVELRRAVRRERRRLTTRERAQALWDRLLGREDYETFVHRLMEREAAEEAGRRDDDLRRREEAFARRLEAALEEERRLETERATDLDRIRSDAAEAERRLEAELASAPERAVADAVRSELLDAGLLSRDAGGALRATSRLVERFAELVYSEESRKVPSMHGRSVGLYVEGSGFLVREPLLSAYEVSHMDTVATLVNARTRHPRVRRIYEADVLVHREERESSTHVVIVFDRSGSMEENGRLEAAKRAVLALHQAVKRDNRENRVDVVAMDTRVEVVDLDGVWAATPRGFTNTGAALKMAGALFRRSRAERGILYLVTDGLPEAFTRDGEDVAGHPDRALEFALGEARALRGGSQPTFVQVLLEPDDPRYVKAAERLAKELSGRVLKVEPRELARTLLREFGSDVATAAAAP